MHVASNASEGAGVHAGIYADVGSGSQNLKFKSSKVQWNCIDLLFFKKKN